MAEFEPAPLRSKIERESGDGIVIATVAFEGDIDLPVVDEFRDALSPDGLEDADGVVIDLTGVRFIDSSGIYALITAWSAQSDSSERAKVVVETGSNVERVLKMTGVLAELAPAPDRDTARAAITGRG